MEYSGAYLSNKEGDEPLKPHNLMRAFTILLIMSHKREKTHLPICASKQDSNHPAHPRSLTESSLYA